MFTSLAQGGNWFVARQLLRGVPVALGVHYDLESSFWLLLGVVLRHTKTNLPTNTCATVFPYGDNKEVSDAKRIWLGDEADDELKEQLVVIGNQPLTTLLFEFRALIRRNVLQWRTWQVSYDDVFKLLEAALAKAE